MPFFYIGLLTQRNRLSLRTSVATRTHHSRCIPFDNMLRCESHHLLYRCFYLSRLTPTCPLPPTHPVTISQRTHVSRKSVLNCPSWISAVNYKCSELSCTFYIYAFSSEVKPVHRSPLLAKKGFPAAYREQKTRDPELACKALH